MKGVAQLGAATRLYWVLHCSSVCMLTLTDLCCTTLVDMHVKCHLPCSPVLGLGSREEHGGRRITFLRNRSQVAKNYLVQPPQPCLLLHRHDLRSNENWGNSIISRIRAGHLQQKGTFLQNHWIRSSSFLQLRFSHSLISPLRSLTSPLAFTSFN